MTEGGEGCVIYGRIPWNRGRKLAHSVNRLSRKASPEAIKHRVNARMQNLQPTFEARRIEALEVLKIGRGAIKLLAERWGISHTQVRRFIKKHIPS